MIARLLTLLTASCFVAVHAQTWEDVCKPGNRINSVEEVVKMFNAEDDGRQFAHEREAAKLVVSISDSIKRGYMCMGVSGRLYNELGRRVSGGLLSKNKLCQPMVEFLTNLGLSISLACKQNALDRLEEVEASFKPAQMVGVTKMQANGVFPIKSEDLSLLTKSNSFALAGRLHGKIFDACDSNRKYIEADLDESMTMSMKRIKSSCNNYISLYWSLLQGPLVLAGVGLDYNSNGHETNKLIGSTNTNEILTKWLNVALVCEAARCVYTSTELHKQPNPLNKWASPQLNKLEPEVSQGKINKEALRELDKLVGVIEARVKAGSSKHHGLFHKNKHFVIDMARDSATKMEKQYFN